MQWQRYVGVAVVLAAQGAAQAQSTARVDFEGLSALVGDLRADVAVSSFYNGGSSASLSTGLPVATGPSPSLGISFSSDARATETSAGGNGGASSVFGLTRNLLLEDGSHVLNSSALGTGVAFSNASVMTVSFAAGFNTGLSFFFNANSDLTVSVLRADGSSLAADDFSFSGTTLCPATQSRCEWSAASLAFQGTGYVVKFAGVAGDFALDNITFGSLDPLTALSGIGGGGGGGGGTGGGGGGVVSPIPEPSTYAMMALGLGLIGLMAHRRQRARQA